MADQAGLIERGVIGGSRSRAGVMHGRIAPERMFPAADPRFVTTYHTLALRTGPATVRVIECGDPDAARVVFCVHGWACSVYSYRRLMPLLARAGMRAVALDLPGHGLSDKPSCPALYTLDAQSEAVLAAMDAAGVSRAVLVGHSMGGPICARTAVLAPERVAALALLAPAGFGTEWDLRFLRGLTPRVVAPVLPYLLRRWMIAAVLAFAYGRLYRPSSRDVDEYWAPSQFPGFVGAMWDLLHRFEWDAGVDAGFGTITMPTIILDGRLDNLVLRRWVERYAAVLPNAMFETIENCGHVVPEEAPELVAAAIGTLIN
ncbi:MAG: alpha/beta hydrolase [Gemmatimonadaceae bacterium]